jgi:hypothetical protein
VLFCLGQEGIHTIRVTVSGKKHPLSKGFYVDLDGFGVKLKKEI